jgi:hypothetical protein
MRPDWSISGRAFTSLIAENNARNRLQELADDADRGH